MSRIEHERGWKVVRPVRDERSEESAVKTEGTPFYKCKCGDVFKRTGDCPHTDKKYESGEEFVKSVGVIKTHHTCRHSNQHDFSCGSCISKQIQAERTRIIKALEGMKKRWHIRFEHTPDDVENRERRKFNDEFSELANGIIDQAIKAVGESAASQDRKESK